ncbi:hypothetical protein M404DRAFT_312134 [Pisolithus tinctorius Marx 270]|uniref:Uncharacterized protein n=1 Tax=Pisolithus tinctorius Marx 270 TaxID=870435 RepID=A0A0C3NJM5_PISTI|nr:hypothetical protein M404DRAFT_312134 [Pisolithus tinctorius Marx 270]
MWGKSDSPIYCLYTISAMISGLPGARIADTVVVRRRAGGHTPVHVRVSNSPTCVRLAHP